MFYYYVKIVYITSAVHNFYFFIYCKGRGKEGTIHETDGWRVKLIGSASHNTLIAPIMSVVQKGKKVT